MCIIDDLNDNEFDRVVSLLDGKHIKNGKYKCWPWIAGKNSDGYGQVHLHDENGKTLTYKSHRIMWSSHNNTMLGNWQVLHTCDNPSCVNPEHLFLGTHNDNMKDMVAKGRVKKGEQSGNVILTENLIKEIRKINIGISQRAIADLYGVSQPQICRIINRESWRHVK